MSAAAFARIALLLKEQSKKKGFWVAIASILLAPIVLVLLLIVMLINVFAGVAAFFNDGLDVYENAVKIVAREKEIENSISPYLVKTLHISYTKYTIGYATQTEIVEFIKANLIKETITTILVPVEKEETNSTSTSASLSSSSSIDDEEEETEYEEKLVYLYRFYFESELFEMAKKYPFSIPIEELQFICALAFNPDSNMPITPGDFINPVAGNVSSMYGQRIHPITGKPEFHTGLDIAAAWHDPLYAITDGTVYKVSKDKSYGHNLTLKHEKNGEVFYAFYAHMSRIDVRHGQSVFAGQVVGLEGGQPGADDYPGDSTGHHLHFEIRLTPYLASHVNPLAYIKGY